MGICHTSAVERIARVLAGECLSINANGTTVLMATHDATIVDQMRRRVLELSAGELIRDQAQGVYGYQ